MTSEWEPCMSGIRKEKKYFQLRKQLKTCENFQENYFVISMPKKRKGVSDDEEDVDQNANIPPPSQQHQSSFQNQHEQQQQQINSVNLNTSNMNIPIISTRNILRFDDSTNQQPIHFINTQQPVNPPVKTLPNGLVEYNNVKISTSNNFETKKKKRKVQSSSTFVTNPPPPPNGNMHDVHNQPNYNHSMNNMMTTVQNNSMNNPESFGNNSFLSDGAIINAQIMNCDDNSMGSFNLLDAQILEANFIPLPSGSSGIPLFPNNDGNNDIQFNELDSVSISFSEPFYSGEEFNFGDLPDIELFGSVELGFAPSER